MRKMGWSGRLHRGALGVAVVGVAVTAALTAGAEISYRHNQHHLAALETTLTGDVLDAAPIDFERRLNAVAGVVANSADPQSAFRRLIAASMRPSGPFASATLIQVAGGRATVLTHVGTRPIQSLRSPSAEAYYVKVARSPGLVTTRAVGHGIQKLVYLMSSMGSTGTFVVTGAQQLPLHDILRVPRTSPDAGLDLAIYFGTAARPSTLVASTSRHLPSGADLSRAVVPFGTHRLTVVAAPRTALAGSLTYLLPWLVAAGGLGLTILVALLFDRLIGRERHADELAKQNALLYQEQRDVALTLQRALIPASFPEIDGVTCAGAYIPGVRGTEVGGDWYSVIEADDKRVYFVVGDVSGRGIEAAALMARLRFTTRTLAMIGYEPADIVERVSRDIDLKTARHFATMLVGVIDDRRTVTVASAGHLPPLLVGAGGAEFMAIKTGAPLGVHPAAYESVTVSLAESTTIVAFTDGLVETRTAPIDAGLERLRDAATAHRAAPVGDLVSALSRALIPDGSDDDVALLAIHCVPSRVPARRGLPPHDPAVQPLA
jgi:serine phosphatase RsbU (regulator of sigma subunit)